MTRAGWWVATVVAAVPTIASPPPVPDGVHVRRGLSATEIHAVADPVRGATAYRFGVVGGATSAWADSTRAVFPGLEPDRAVRIWCEARNDDGVSRSEDVVGYTLPHTTHGHGTLGGTNVGGLYRPTYWVTSLGDRDVPGTLRYGLTRGNAYIVFATPGTIQLRDKLRVTSNHVTVDATSAGGRVVLVPHPGDEKGSNARSGLLIDEAYPARAHHMIIDGLTIVDGRKDNLSIGGDDRTSDPARAAYGIVVRHSVFLRAGDGNLDVAQGANHVTLQGNIFGQNVKNSLLGSSSVDSLLAVTVHRNFIVEGKSRSPQIQGRADSILVSNNVVMDYGSYGVRTQCHVEHGASCASVSLRADLVGNVFLPSSPTLRYEAIRHLDGTHRGVHAVGNWSDLGVVHEFGTAPRRTSAASWVAERLRAEDAAEVVREAGTPYPSSLERGWRRAAVARVSTERAVDRKPPSVRGRPRAWESCPDSLRLLVDDVSDDRSREKELWFRWYLERGGDRGAPTDSSIWVDRDSYEWGGLEHDESVTVWVRAMDAAGNISTLSKPGRATTTPDRERPKAINDFRVEPGDDPSSLVVVIDDSDTRDNCTRESRYTFVYHVSTTSSRDDAVRRGPFASHVEYVGGRIGNAVVHTIDRLEPATAYSVWVEVIDGAGNSRVSRKRREAHTATPPERVPAPDAPSARVRARGDALVVDGWPGADDIEIRVWTGLGAGAADMTPGEWVPSSRSRVVVTGQPRRTTIYVRTEARRVGGWSRRCRMPCP